MPEPSFNEATIIFYHNQVRGMIMTAAEVVGLAPRLDKTPFGLTTFYFDNAPKFSLSFSYHSTSQDLWMGVESKFIHYLDPKIDPQQASLTGRKKEEPFMLYHAKARVLEGAILNEVEGLIVPQTIKTVLSLQQAFQAQQTFENSLKAKQKNSPFPLTSHVCIEQEKFLKLGIWPDRPVSIGIVSPFEEKYLHSLAVHYLDIVPVETTCDQWVTSSLERKLERPRERIREKLHDDAGLRIVSINDDVKNPVLQLGSLNPHLPCLFILTEGEIGRTSLTPHDPFCHVQPVIHAMNAHEHAVIVEATEKDLHIASRLSSREVRNFIRATHLERAFAFLKK